MERVLTESADCPCESMSFHDVLYTVATALTPWPGDGLGERSVNTILHENGGSARAFAIRAGAVC